MKKVQKVLVEILGVLILIITFISCTEEKSSLKKEEKTTIASVDKTQKIVKKETLRKPVVFITGIDKGSNTFYKNARDYYMEKQFEIVDNSFSIQEIIMWLNKNYDGNSYGEIHVVTQGNPWNGISLETTIHSGRTTNESLENILAEGKLPKVEDVISANTNIVFHSCGLGKNKDLMKSLTDVFTTENTPNLIASPFYTIFGGKFSKHFLATPYYVFYPTAKSPGKMDLSKEIAAKYPKEKDIDWFDALNNEEERYVGEAYTYQYNIPVNFELDFTNSDNEVPVLKTQKEVINFIEENENLLKDMVKLEIPLEKYRWSTSVKNNSLIIKGKTTVLCVLKPIIKPFGDLQHLEPKIDNARLYATF